MNAEPEKLSALARRAWAHFRLHPFSTTGWVCLALFLFLGTQTGQMALMGLALFALITVPLGMVSGIALRAMDRRRERQASSD